VLASARKSMKKQQIVNMTRNRRPEIPPLKEAVDMVRMYRVEDTGAMKCQ